MKHLSFLLAIIGIFTITSCKNKPTKSAITTSDTIHFFSIKDFFLAEVKDVETTPYFIYKITTKANDGKDSTSLSKAAFANFVQQFIACDVADSSIKGNYKETAFKDNSTKSITLNYSTLNRSLPIQNIDVLLNEETNKVTRIFIRKIVENVDSSATILYSWKANKSCMVTTSSSKKNGETFTETQFVNWNDKE